MKRDTIIVDKGTKLEERIPRSRYHKHHTGWYTVEYSDGSTALVRPSRVTVEGEEKTVRKDG